MDFFGNSSKLEKRDLFGIPLKSSTTDPFGLPPKTSSSSQRHSGRSSGHVEEILNETVLVCAMGLGHYIRLHVTKPFFTWPFTLTVYPYGIKLAQSKRYLDVLYRMDPQLVPQGVWHWFYHLSADTHQYIVLGTVTFCVSVVLGIQLRFVRTKYQKIFQTVGLANGLKDTPVLLKHKNLKGGREKLLFDSKGIGISRFEAAKDNLEAAFGKSVESIEYGKNQKRICLILTKRRLPQFITYQEVASKQKLKPYSFFIGASTDGIEQKTISDIPHMLIAGTVGSGKSIFFKQALLGLLTSSDHLQMYLIDLKGGLEMTDFIGAPNVCVVKTMKEAVYILGKLKKEMKERFDYLERKKLKQIQPKRDKKERIIVGVDEASVLYMKRAKEDPDFGYALRARQLTDDLAKLSRAAAIHLILATQKVTKETIDTNIQENISARMCFKMNTLQGSLIPLGTREAMDLPDNKGRGIWSLGNRKITVQGPYLTEVDIAERCNRVAAEFQKGVRKFFNPMLDVSSMEKQTEALSTQATKDLEKLQKSSDCNPGRDRGSGEKNARGFEGNPMVKLPKSIDGNPEDEEPKNDV